LFGQVGRCMQVPGGSFFPDVPAANPGGGLEFDMRLWLLAYEAEGL